MQTQFQIQVSPVAEHEKEDGSSGSESDSGFDSESSKSSESSDFSEGSAQCKIRQRRSGSIIKFSPSEFRPPTEHGVMKKTSEAEGLLVPVATNKTSFSSKRKGTPTLRSDKTAITENLPKKQE